jgi:hypothetical protein
VFLAGRTSTPLAEMAVDDFTAPVETGARTTFPTARAAARHMIPRRSGAILAFGGPGDRSGPARDYYLEGTRVAFDTIETIRRQLAEVKGFVREIFGRDRPGPAVPGLGTSGARAGWSSVLVSCPGISPEFG